MDDGAPPVTPAVLVVGAGPVGLCAANLLAARGIPVLLVERNTATSDEAKAISLDDESLRTLQTADLAEDVLGIVVPGTGTRYYDRHGRALFHARGPRRAALGYPFKNQFAQPELERTLLGALMARPEADVRFGTQLVGLTDAAGGVVVTLRTAGRGPAEDERVPVAWVLGCDGGRSTVREIRGVSMTGASHREVWLVVDTLGDAHDERYGMHLGTPSRPTVIVPGRGGRCRYEFLLRPGEAAAGAPVDFALVRRLLAPHRAVTEDQIERCTAYTFNGVVAERWRDGSCFLLGDAAHMMPPFAGQGLNSGIRDAANLVWKLDAVVRGDAHERLLDTYEAERRPHAAAVVRYSERLGEVVMTTNRRRALVRDLAVRTLLRIPPARRYLTEMRFRPVAVHRDGLVLRTGACDESLVGTLLPQFSVLVPPTLRPHPLDELLGPGLVLLGVDVPATAWAPGRASLDPWGPRCVAVTLGDHLPRWPAAPGGQDSTVDIAVADADGRLQQALGHASGRFVLIKPDRHVAAVFGPDQAAQIADQLGSLMGFPRARAARTAGDQTTDEERNDGMGIQELGHTGFWVDDLPTMRDFYTRVLGLTVTDEDDDLGIVFLSSRPDEEHHELVLQRGRTAPAGSRLTHQVSWRVDSLETVLRFHRRFRDEGIDVQQEVTHGNAIGIYFFDPEGNRNEVYLRIDRDVTQPFRKTLNLDQDPMAVLADAERLLSGDGPAYQPVQ